MYLSIYVYTCAYIHGNMPTMNMHMYVYTYIFSNILFSLRVVCKAHMGTYFHFIKFCMLSKK